jgi:hypothetical protein
MTCEELDVPEGLRVRQLSKGPYQVVDLRGVTDGRRGEVLFTGNAAAVKEWLAGRRAARSTSVERRDS